MKLKIPAFLLAILAFFGVSSCSTVSPVPTTVTNGIPNFAIVDPGIYRGGQPTIEGWQYLKSIGVTNVIKLNERDESSDRQAIELGLKIFYHPINLADQAILKPNKADVFKAVSQITTNTYIHCEHGQDRTGLIVGIYRIQVNHWTKQKAYDEMLTHGFHKILHGLDDFWEDDVK